MDERPQGAEPSLADDLLVGASAIATFVYGNSDPPALKDVYRNVLALPIFKHGAQLAARKSVLVAEIAGREHAAREVIKERKDSAAAVKRAQPKNPAKRRARRAPAKAVVNAAATA
jgi:hypothetical protein